MPEQADYRWMLRFYLAFRVKYNHPSWSRWRTFMSLREVLLQLPEGYSVLNWTREDWQVSLSECQKLAEEVYKGEHQEP